MSDKEKDRGPKVLGEKKELLAAFMLGAIVALGLGRAVVWRRAVSYYATIQKLTHDVDYPKWPPPSICNETVVPRGLGLPPLLLEQEEKDAPPVPERMIVVARHREDTSWLDVYLPEIPHIIYQVDDAHVTGGMEYRTKANKGTETMAYLQFIIDFYDKLPEYTVFMHAHRYAWHLEDHVPVLRRLKWGSFPFANLRYAPGERLQWKCGDRTNTMWKTISCNWVGLKLRPQGMGPRSHSIIGINNRDEWIDSTEISSLWKQLFQSQLGDPPPILHSACCAEFIVSAERIRRHPIEFYKKLREWILDVEIDSYRCGRQFEYTWHYIMGEPAISPPKFECDLLYCDKEQLQEATYYRDRDRAEVEARLEDYKSNTPQLSHLTSSPAGVDGPWKLSRSRREAETKRGHHSGQHADPNKSADGMEGSQRRGGRLAGLDSLFGVDAQGGGDLEGSHGSSDNVGWEILKSLKKKWKKSPN